MSVPLLSSPSFPSDFPLFCWNEMLHHNSPRCPQSTRSQPHCVHAPLSTMSATLPHHRHNLIMVIIVRYVHWYLTIYCFLLRQVIRNMHIDPFDLTLFPMPGTLCKGCENYILLNSVCSQVRLFK